MINYKQLFPFILVLIIGASPNIAKKIWNADPALPIEFQYLIENLQIYKNNTEDNQAINAKIKELNQLFTYWDQNDLNSFLRLEISKLMLQNNRKSSFDFSNYHPEIIPQGKKILEENSEFFTSFTLWFYLSAEEDLRNIISSPFHATLLQRLKAKTPIKEKELLRMQKKISILFPIFEELLSFQPEELQDRIRSQLVSLLSQLTINIQLINQLSASTSVNKKIFFQLKEQVEKSKKSKIVDILEKVKNDPNKKEPKVHWSPREDAPLYPTPDPDYIPPEILPAPIYTWPDETVPLFPTPDPYYRPPTFLPQPINDWDETESIPENSGTNSDALKKQEPFNPDREWFLE